MNVARTHTPPPLALLYDCDDIIKKHLYLFFFISFCECVLSFFFSYVSNIEFFYDDYYNLNKENIYLCD